MAKILLVGCSVLLVIVLVVLCNSAYHIINDLKESPWCQQGLQLACSNVEVRKELGTPLKLGWLAAGSQVIVRGEGGGSGRATISVPIKGSDGKGRLHLEARMKDGDWELEVAEVMLHSMNRVIDLLDHGTQENDT